MAFGSGAQLGIKEVAVFVGVWSSAASVRPAFNRVSGDIVPVGTSRRTAAF